MNTKVRQQLRKRKRKLLRRISVEHGKWQSPMIRPAATRLELTEKQQAVNCGGLAAIVEMVKALDVRKELSRSAKVLKLNLPYDEADHIFNIAFNLLAGGTCLDHIEHRRNDEAYLDALGAQRIPDPTTAGDFCRRFSHDRHVMARHTERIDAIRTHHRTRSLSGQFGAETSATQPPSADAPHTIASHPRTRSSDRRLSHTRQVEARKQKRPTAVNVCGGSMFNPHFLVELLVPDCPPDIAADIETTERVGGSLRSYRRTA